MVKTRHAAHAKVRTPKKINNPPLEEILNECAIAVGQGVASAGTITFDPRAARFWLTRFRKSIQKARRILSWKAGRANVLTVANHLGKAAADLSTGGVISLQNAKDAAAQIKNDPACPGAGGGRWCV